LVLFRITLPRHTSWRWPTLQFSPFSITIRPFQRNFQVYGFWILEAKTGTGKSLKNMYQIFICMNRTTDITMSDLASQVSAPFSWPHLPADSYPRPEMEQKIQTTSLLKVSLLRR
jgi:hypothetical protein